MLRFVLGVFDMCGKSIDLDVWVICQHDRRRFQKKNSDQGANEYFGQHGVPLYWQSGGDCASSAVFPKAPTFLVGSLPAVKFFGSFQQPWASGDCTRENGWFRHSKALS
jgi:hypothetical protein